MKMHFKNEKAALVAPKTIELITEDIVDLPSDSVLLKVAYCGICGSDIPRFFQGKVHNFPLVLGHEFSGEVISKGDRVTKFAIGDRVAGIPLVPCMQCPECKNGHYQLCSNYSFIGSRQAGAFQKYLILKEENIFKLLPGTDLMSAALIEPLTVAIHAVKLVKSLKDESQVAIFGFGVIGACLAAYLKDKGFHNITIITNSNKRKGIAEKLNIDEFYRASDKSVLLKKFDVVFDCTSISSALEFLLPLINPRGAISIIGSKNSQCEISATAFNLIQRHEIQVIGSWMSYSALWPGEEWLEAREVLLKYPDCFKDLIQNVFPLKKVPEAFEDVINNSPKVLIAPNEE